MTLAGASLPHSRPKTTGRDKESYVTLNDLIASARRLAEAATDLEDKLECWKAELFGNTTGAASHTDGKKRGRPPKAKQTTETSIPIATVSQSEADPDANTQ